MNSIGVIGNGYVGSAVHAFFHSHGCDVRVFDTNPERSTHHLVEACQADFVFVCVPTPTEDGKQDIGAVAAALAAIEEHGADHTVVILKSTVLPRTTRKLAWEFKRHPLVFSPEFLSARTAAEDFAHPTNIVLGGAHELVTPLFKKHWPDVELMLVTWETAEFIKYARNTFYALKVAWWNEMYDLCATTRVDYEAVKQGVLTSGWVNPMHCDVPGHDGQRGFGGACLPKDSEALLAFAAESGQDLTILRAAVESNDKIRGSNDRAGE